MGNLESSVLQNVKKQTNKNISKILKQVPITPQLFRRMLSAVLL